MQQDFENRIVFSVSDFYLRNFTKKSKKEKQCLYLQVLPEDFFLIPNLENSLNG